MIGIRTSSCLLYKSVPDCEERRKHRRTIFMRKSGFPILLCAILLVSVLGCGKERDLGKRTGNELHLSGTEKKERAVRESPFKITFIELGSVNCIPCKMMQPVMKEIEEKYPSTVKIIFYDVRTEEGKPYAQKYGIRVIPTQVFLDDEGNEFHRHEGFYPKEQLENVIIEKLKKIK